jgi:SnoaL-like domain
MELTAADRFAIQDLYTEYNRANDAADAERWADVFTEDGEYVPGLGPFIGQRYNGRDELLTFHGTPRPLRVRHWNPDLMPVLTDKGDYIEGICYCIVLDISQDPPAILGHSTYTDELVKDDVGHWRIRARRSLKDLVPRDS